MLTILDLTCAMIVVLMLNGAAGATAFGPGYLMFENIVERLGLTEDRGKIRIMVASYYSIVRSSFKVVGALLLGGFMQDAFGFYYTCLFIGVVQVSLMQPRAHFLVALPLIFLPL